MKRGVEEISASLSFKRQKTSLESIDPLLWKAMLLPLDLAFRSESQSFKGLHEIVMSYAVSWFQGEFNLLSE
jgi:hypothetical protein